MFIFIGLLVVIGIIFFLFSNNSLGESRLTEEEKFEIEVVTNYVNDLIAKILNSIYGRDFTIYDKGDGTILAMPTIAHNFNEDIMKTHIIIRCLNDYQTVKNVRLIVELYLENNVIHKFELSNIFDDNFYYLDFYRKSADMLKTFIERTSQGFAKAMLNNFLNQK